MPYADVCVNTPLSPRVGASLGADADPLGRAFTYAVPDHLAGRLQPGYLVWLPFRGRRLQAVVLAVTEEAPDFETREIEAVVWAQPPLTPAQLALARWLSAYYLVPLIDALRLMLPVGISQRGRTVLVRTQTPAPPDGSTELTASLTPTQKAVLDHIAETEGTWAEVTEGLKGVTQRADLEPLIEKDLVTREVAFLTPPPRPKFDRQVRLEPKAPYGLADAETVARALPTLGHASKQADVLAWLAQPRMGESQSDRTMWADGQTSGNVILSGSERQSPPHSQQSEESPSGGRDPSLEARRGALQPANPLRVTGSTEADSSQSDENAPTPKRRGIASWGLRSAELARRGPIFRTASLDELCAAVGCTDGPVKALEKRGWVSMTRRSAKEPAQVSLTLAPDAVLDALIELRGAAKHRAVLEALQRHDGPAWIGWVYAETGATLDTLRDLEAAGLITITEEMVWRDPLAGHEFTLDQPPVLTEDQERVWEVVRQRIEADKRMGAGGQKANGQIPQSAVLLHGVTGSGKTEIYLRAIAEVLKRGQQAVVLVPEIALTPQTIRRFAARFPGKVTVWHSELGDGERFDVWRRVRTGHPAAQVVVGSRSALFLPFPELGLIVLDEEHENAYKQQQTPRYHARTVAIELGKICNAPVILGSATPALETYYAARQGAIQLLTLPRRILAGGQGGRGAGEQGPAQSTNLPSYQFSAELPAVQVVDMRQELRAGNRSMFSRALTAAMEKVLAAKQQAILYLNRRGAATFVLCRDCGHVEACPRCAMPLTYHSAGETLLCHHCNRRYPVPFTCPECQSKRIRYFGSGTQNVEEAVQTAFPKARTLRWDRDVTGAKGAHDAILSRFTAHEADVLIGTQMIAKGLDLPLVTLVGVIAADVGLFLPDFRAGERTFQLLTQVAGRAGRSALGGQVIVQTYHPDHYAIVAASRHDYESFYRQEMVFRRQQGYPPIRRLARLECHHSQRAKAQAEATRLAEQLRAEIARLALPDTDLIGPAPCFFGQQRGEYRWQVVVRSPDPTLLLRNLAIPLGWRLDIDPVDLL